MYADETDLRAVRSRLLNVQDPAALASYLQVFSNRPMPDFSDQLLTFLDHENEKVRFRAFNAVAQITNPSIRKFALDHLHDRIGEPNYLRLFIHSFLPGDEDLLLESLRIPEDLDDLHALLMDVRKILEHNPESKCHELAKIVYRLTPCGSCRHGAAKLLINRKVAPVWLA